jgi:lipoyl(octanoyl) transferase
VYVAGAKIMALGLRVRRGCSFHGLALNVAMDPAPWARINPCGYAGLAVTTVLDCGGPGRLDVVAAVLLAALARHFSCALVDVESELPAEGLYPVEPRSA